MNEDIYGSREGVIGRNDILVEANTEINRDADGIFRFPDGMQWMDRF